MARTIKKSLGPVFANDICSLADDAARYVESTGRPFRTALKTTGKRYDKVIMIHDLKRKKRGTI